MIAPVAPDTILHGGDVLRFVGMADQVLDLQGIRGLSSAEETHLVELNTSKARYFEAVIGATSPMVGTTLKEIGFRQRYQAAVVAIHRAGQRIDAKLGSVPLRVGDTLLLIADPGFREQVAQPARLPVGVLNRRARPRYPPPKRWLSAG